MPPKKNQDNSGAPAKVAKERAPRKRMIKVKDEKPKLKTPTIVRVRMPTIRSLNVGSQNSAISKTNKGSQSPELNPAEKRKIDLANEVALAQLVKPNTSSNEVKKALKKPIVRRRVKSGEAPIKKRARPKRGDALESLKEESETTNTETETVSQVIVPVKKKRVYTRKNSVKNIEKKTDSESEFIVNNTKRQKPDTTTKELTVKKRCIRKPKASENSEPSNVEKTADEVYKKKLDQAKTPSAPAKRRMRKGKTKTIDTDVTTTQDKSPCVWEEASKILEKRLRDSEKAIGTVNPKKSVPETVNSRKTSVSECFSWTKDISSSSTTTCVSVGSNSIVRLNNKIPVLRLSNIDNKWKKVQESKVEKVQSDSEQEDAKSTSSSSSSSSSSNSTSSSEPPRQTELNLSTSSISPSKSFVTHTSATKDEDWEYAFIKITTNLKKLDIEAINWIGYENQTISEDIDIVQDKIFKLLKFENQVLQDCQNISKSFGNKDIENEMGREDGEQKSTHDPNTYLDRSDDDNFTSTQSRYVMFDQNCRGEEDLLQSKDFEDISDQEEDSVVKDVPLETSNYNDDDDALSLFAESITGLESSRYNNSANSLSANVSEYEEYIPQPMVYRESDGPGYVPTKISDSQNYKTKIICEKQNADSTSINRDSESFRAVERNENIVSDTMVNKPVQTIVRQVVNFQPRPLKKRLKLMSLVHKPLHCTKSTVFHGVCFYNLISNCKKLQCRYPHVQLDSLEVRNRLTTLTEATFIQEYMLLRTWPSLRRMYGKLYVAECIERKLTNTLVEMAIDFISKSKLEDSALKTSVCEDTLLYLNDVDLSICEDLLKYDFGDTKGLLCGELMRVIASSQNFSRFKPVFLKLTNFINDIQGKFEFDVADNILERVGILNCEKSLARAMLIIIAHTDAKIFENSMMAQFETQLLNLDRHLYAELGFLKEKAMKFSKESVRSPMINQGADLNMMHKVTEERYTSPDTTKLENSNKLHEEAPRQVKIIRPSIFSQLFQKDANASTSTHLNKIGDDRYRNWQANNFSPSIRGRGFRRPAPYHIEPMRPQLKRRMDQRQVEFGNTPPKFGRRSGSEYF